MIVERTEYFARSGFADRVLEIRRRACTVRRELGLSGGRIFTRRPESDAPGPDVVWECDFAYPEEQAADLAARAASPAFEEVRREMTACLTRFARHVVERDCAPLPNGMRPVDLRGHPIVPREMTVGSDGRDLKGYFFTPPGSGPFPCMMLNHGSGIDKGTLDVSRPGTASVLMSWGIASFLLHRRGYGNSPGPGWREEVTAPFGTPEYGDQLAERLDHESDDVLAALERVRALPEVRAEHIGVMGSSFGGVNTLLAASKSGGFTCAVEFAGAAMNWDRTPRLRELMIGAARRLALPIFFIQAENDYSTRPTRELAAACDNAGKVVWSKIFPAFGINPDEGHLLESRGPGVWGEDVRRFLERYL
jgi:dienelactone hydrolase